MVLNIDLSLHGQVPLIGRSKTKFHVFGLSKLSCFSLWTTGKGGEFQRVLKNWEVS